MPLYAVCQLIKKYPKLLCFLQLRAVREEAMILRGLHNMQPKELFSDQVTVSFSHPDHSQTEVSVVGYRVP